MVFARPLAAASLIALCTSALAGPSIVLPVSADESVNSGFAEKNYADNMNRGGLFVGNDGTGVGIARFYLKFALPKSIRAADVAQATLWAVHQDDLDPSDNGIHRIHFVAADDWREETINWANQPGPTFGSPEATFDAGATRVGEVVTWDVTDVTRRELDGDRMLSLLFAATNESTERTNRNWEYFAEREFDAQRAFHLSLSTNSFSGGGNVTAAVPLPAAAWPGLITLAGAACAIVKKRKRTR